MAEIRLSIADAAMPRAVAALCALYGYEAAKEREPALTEAQFAKRVVAGWVRDQVIVYETRQAAETARLAADAKARAEVTVT